MFKKKETKDTRPVQIDDDINPKNRDVMTSLMALARAVAELRREVRGK